MPSDLELDAAHWAIRLQEGALSDEEDRALETWVAGDARRSGALLRAQAGWRRLELLSGEGDVAAPRRRSQVGRRALMGAGLAAALTAGFFALPLLKGEPRRFSTERGEVRRVSLEDGSAMVINTASLVTEHYAPQERRLDLDEGEAWFDVRHDQLRPFIVAAGDVRVRAVGTAFSVRRRGRAVEVIVTEGVVEASVRGKAPVRVAAGSRALVVADQPVVEKRDLPPAAVDGALAWREGRIVLDQQTLAEAAEEFNRHNVRQMVIASADLRGRRLVGVFRANDPEGFARAVSPLIDAEAEVKGDSIVLRTLR